MCQEWRKCHRILISIELRHYALKESGAGYANTSGLPATLAQPGVRRVRQAEKMAGKKKPADAQSRLKQ
jgi:hypothetical protein